VPYNVAIVQLAEGPLMITNIVDCPNDEIEIGKPVHVVFERVADDVTIPKFAPSGNAAA
jgi:uncharacterized OB-fold protein